MSCAKTSGPIGCYFWGMDSGGPNEACVRWGAR